MCNQDKPVVNLTGFDIYSDSKENCLKEVFSKSKVHVVSGNPEVLYTALQDEVLGSAFRDDSTLIIPDGVGTRVAAKLKGLKITEKIAGVEFMIDIISRCEEEGKSIYLLGTNDKSLNACINSLKSKFNNLIIAGSHNGYFDANNSDEIINDIKNSSPDALFVAMGCPRQERFILSYMDILPTKIFMGVGGSFDVIGGIKKRAPKIIVSLGLEWLYRVIKEPFRIKRLNVIPKYIFKAIRYKK